MSIQAVNAASRMQYGEQPEKPAAYVRKTAQPTSFSEILESLTSAPAASDSSVATVTVTKVLPDGSLVLVKMQGNQVISQSKLSGASVQMQQNMLGSSGVLPQEYLAKSTSAAGSLFSASI